MSGNKATQEVSISSTTLWSHTYTADVTNYGTYDNSVTKAKTLRDCSVMVAGESYEPTAWQSNIQTCAWWSLIDIFNSGAELSHDTAGLKHNSGDAIYDFAQLDNGDIVFIGLKGFGMYNTLDTGLWIIVTDSSGSTQKCQRQFDIPYSGAYWNNFNPHISRTPKSADFHSTA